MIKEEKQTIPVCCGRCGERSTTDLASEWVLGITDGQIVAVICPSCLTESEHLMVEVNDAMTELDHVAPEEGFVVKPKDGEET